jgi:glycosyltransferase involved in cell wall biosynthesis
MAAGCLVLGSNTAPVQEVIQDGKNGLLVDFFNPEAIADRVDEVLNHPDRMAELRTRARKTIVQHYDLATLLPQQLRWLGALPPTADTLKSIGAGRKFRSTQPRGFSER